MLFLAIALYDAVLFKPAYVVSRELSPLLDFLFDGLESTVMRKGKLLWHGVFATSGVQLIAALVALYYLKKKLDRPMTELARDAVYDYVRLFGGPQKSSPNINEPVAMGSHLVRFVYGDRITSATSSLLSR